MKRMPKHEKSPLDMVGARFYESSRETTGRSSPPTASATQDPSACRRAPAVRPQPQNTRSRAEPKAAGGPSGYSGQETQEPKATHTKVRNGSTTHEDRLHRQNHRRHRHRTGHRPSPPRPSSKRPARPVLRLRLLPKPHAPAQSSPPGRPGSSLRPHVRAVFLSSGGRGA